MRASPSASIRLGRSRVAPLTGLAYLRSPDGTFITFNPPGATATAALAINPAGAITGLYCGRKLRGSRLPAGSRRHLHHVRSAGLHIHVPHRHQPGWRHHRSFSGCKRRSARVCADPVSQSNCRPRKSKGSVQNGDGRPNDKEWSSIISNVEWMEFVAGVIDPAAAAFRA